MDEYIVWAHNLSVARTLAQNLIEIRQLIWIVCVLCVNEIAK